MAASESTSSAPKAVAEKSIRAGGRVSGAHLRVDEHEAGHSDDLNLTASHAPAQVVTDDSSSETGGTDHSWVARITPAAAKRGTCDSGH